MRDGFLRLLVAALAATLAGCTTYVGHKLNPDGALPPSATGIPYTMTKPEFTVNVTADVDDPSKAVYTLSKSDVPDPYQRYTITLDPALFTDGKFTVKLGENGNLTEATSVVTSRVVTTIKAVGTVALNQAKGAYDSSSPAGLALDRYREYLKGSTQFPCTTTVMPGGRVSFKIDSAIMALMEKGEKEKLGSGIDTAISGYFYTSLNEKDCLAAVRTTIETTPIDDVTTALTRYTSATKSIEWVASTTETPPTTEVKIIVKAVNGWVQAKDVDSIIKAVKYAGRYRDVQGLDNFLTAARNYVNQLLAADRVKALARDFDLKPEVWRARFVKSIGREIEVLRFQKDLIPRMELAGNIAERERQRADLVGGIVMFDRIKNIDEFLKQVRTVKSTQDGSVRYAADEHIKLREERDRLDTQLKALIASTVSSDTKGGDKAKIKPRVNQSVRLAGQDFVDKVNAGLGVLFDSPPEFVLVLTRTPGGMFADPPVLMGAKEPQK